jgi:tRNA modification GTPase
MDDNPEPGACWPRQQTQVTCRNMSDRQDTIAAIATPTGNGGIGIVRLSGKKSLDIARVITGSEPVPRYAHVCTFRDQQGRTIDQGILIHFKAPASFTGEDVVEFQAHGGRVVLQLLLQAALQEGARLARPGEFSERAYLNDRIDLVQAEAIADLIESTSSHAARSAVRSLEGEFSENIQRVVDQLVSLRVYVESALDFPEEELDFLANPDLLVQLESAQTALDSLIIRAEAGRRLRAGVRVAIIGKPNVGKSSLLNRLVQTNRSIVSAIAGTTRDTIEDSVLIEGMPVTIIDTAGIHDSADPVEQEGIKRSRDEIEKADIILLVTEDAQTNMPVLIRNNVTQDSRVVIVHNKIDSYGHEPRLEIIDNVPHVYISALTGAGMEQLLQQLSESAGQAPVGEDAILARQRHITSLQAARASVNEGITVFQSAGSAELLAEELRKAQQFLCSITGEFHNDDLLGEIFSRFCIGK